MITFAVVLNNFVVLVLDSKAKAFFGLVRFFLRSSVVEFSLAYFFGTVTFLTTFSSLERLFIFVLNLVGLSVTSILLEGLSGCMVTFLIWFLLNDGFLMGLLSEMILSNFLFDKIELILFRVSILFVEVVLGMAVEIRSVAGGVELTMRP